MKFNDKNRDEATLESTGRVLHFNCGIIGIDRKGDLYGGYDESFWFNAEDEDWGDRPLTAAERAELADEMIARWGRFKEAK